MKKIVSIWQFFKKLLPVPVLNVLRFIYSPGYRAGRRAARLRRRIDAAWQKAAVLAPQRQVLTGPFQGMQYIEKAVCSALPPKVLGTYEKELHGIIETIIFNRPSCIIDIGAAEGFYAVGFAMRIPVCRVVAFEMDRHAQELLRELASINGVTDRVEVKGMCNQETLCEIFTSLPDDCVIICDAEGAEVELLDPTRMPWLRRFPLLVELHPWVQPDIKSVLYSRFTTSSEIITIASRTRTVSDFSIETDGWLSDSEKLDCMSEWRPCGMEWLWIKPRKK